MFEGLKKKFSSFIDAIAKKEEEQVKAGDKKEAAAAAPATHAAQPERIETITPEIEEKAVERQAPARPGIEKREEPKTAPIAKPQKADAQEEQVSPKPVKIHGEENPAIKREETVRRNAERVAEMKPQHVEAEQHAKMPEQKVTFGTRLKSIVFREVRVSRQDVEPFMEQLRISMLQSDVNYEVAEKILARMESELTGNPIDAKNLQRGITGIIRGSILAVLNKGSDIDIVALAQSKKGSGGPFRILFIGPNGAGKTTTMAKMAKKFMDNGFTCVLSASDTFRAAAIEQTIYHGSKLGIHVIRGNYGADPASVAFDAVAYAKAHGIDVVLIDSAGRQETNRSLMEEIKKMVRIAKPDMKIFIGESITGNALLGQVREFNEAVGLDGIILTKLDADAKGGNTISILSETEVPVLFFGTGEAYDALTPYRPEMILDNIVPNN